MDVNNNRSKTDVLLSYNTDIDFEFDDLMMTSDEDLLKRKVFKLLITQFGDWKFDKEIGASPNIFTGEHNTRETAALIKQFIEFNIQQYISPAIIDARIVPIDEDSIKIYITLYVNGLRIASLPYTLDFINGLLYSQYDDRVDKLISTPELKLNTIDDVADPNVYVEKFRLQ